MLQVGTVIIGGGIVGAAVAYSLRHFTSELYILEQESQPGTGTSSRNSGVIHAGLYYPKNSNKMKLCLRGKELLYQFCEQESVPFRQTGKYIVANTSPEEMHLAWLKAHVTHVPLTFVDSLPQGITASKALFSPTTGIVDTHELLSRLIDLSGATLLCNHKVEDVFCEADGVRFRVGDDQYLAERLINCAGLSAPQFTLDYQTVYAKGSYFALRIPDNQQVPELVYPAIPKNAPGLGIHLTRNIHGESFLGPDVTWVSEPNYRVESDHLDVFFQAAKKYLPWLEPEMLQPGYAGLRPKLWRDQPTDFTFVKQGTLLHCLGIESPGITACLAIGEYVREYYREIGKGREP